MDKAKKILSAVIIFAVLISSLCVTAVFADAPSMTDEQVYDFLQFFNIINLSVDDKDSYATRENFAVYTASMLNIKSGKSNVRYFADIENNAYSANSINSLVEMGIIDTNDEARFEPAEKVTGAQALKMLVCAVGGKAYAEAKGGFPYGYITAGRDLGITKNVSADMYITTAQAAELIYNTMTVALVDYDSINNNSVSFKKSNDTILSAYWGIKFASGVVTSVYGTTVDGNKEARSENEIAIDGELYKNSYVSSDPTEYIGIYADYFYKENDFGLDEIVYIKQSEDLGKERIKINIDDFISYSNFKVSYYEGKNSSKTKTETLGAHTLIYNGTQLGTDVSKIMSSLNKGYIYLIDADCDNVYDTVAVYDFENFYTGAFSDDVLYNKLNKNSTVDFNKCDYVIIKDLNGNTINKSEIAADDLLSVALSQDRKSVLIYKTSIEFNGEIESIDKDAKQIKVNGTVYDIDRSYTDYLLDTVKAGDICYFMLDNFNNIGYVSHTSTSNYKTGYIMNYRLTDTISPEIQIKMLCDDSTVNIYTQSDKINIDGNTYQKSQFKGAVNALDNVQGELLVRYELDENEQIRKIDTTTVNSDKETEENSLTAEFYETTKSKWFTVNIVGRRAVANSKTKVFYVPNNKEDADDSLYTVGTAAYMLKNDLSFYMDAYYYSSLNGFADVLVVRFNNEDLGTNRAASRPFFVYSEKEEKLNADGLEATYIKGFSNNGDVTYEVDSSVNLDGLDCGDIAYFYYDSKGRIINNGDIGYTLVYDASKSIEEQKDTEGNHWVPFTDVIKEKYNQEYLLYTYVNADNHYKHEYQVSYGRAAKKYSDGIIKISTRDDFKPTEALPTDGKKIIVVEKGKGGKAAVRSGSADDIVTAESSETDCSKLLCYSKNGQIMCIVVYNLN